MNRREKLVRSKEYGFTTMQLSLLNFIENYMKSKGMNRNELAKDIGVSKGYISQVLNAAYDHKLSKVADLANHCNAMPFLFFVDMDTFVQNDAEDRVYRLLPCTKLKPLSSFKEKPNLDDEKVIKMTSDSGTASIYQNNYGNYYSKLNS